MTKKKSTGKKADTIFYVGVRDSKEVRKNILECARDGIHLLQRYEKLKAIREEKIQTILKLDAEVKELKTLVHNLRKMFPMAKMKVKIPTKKPQCVMCSRTFSTQAQLSRHMVKHEKRERPKKKAVKAVKTVKVAKIDPQTTLKSESVPAMNSPEPMPAPRKKKLSDLEMLEQELADIEGELGNLA